ncbi:hypothetical protein BT96DRAFT_924970, partial [Gymnopus androsaceus JB14]
MYFKFLSTKLLLHHVSPLLFAFSVCAMCLSHGQGFFFLAVIEVYTGSTGLRNIVTKDIKGRNRTGARSFQANHCRMRKYNGMTTFQRIRDIYGTV